MTLTSVPAPVLAAEPASANPSTDAATGSEAAESGSRFASLLQGLNGRGERAGAPAPPAKNAGAGRNPPGTKAPSTQPSADPALAALLHAYANTVAPEARAAAPAPNAPPAAAATTDAPDAATAATTATTTATTATAATAATVAEVLAALTAAAKPAPPASGAPAAPDALAHPTAAATATAPAATDPALVAAASGPITPAPGPGPATGNAARTATSAGEAATTPTTAPGTPAVAHAPNPAPTPAAAGTDAATNTAVAVAAGPNPVVRSDPAPKPESANDNALITAASAAVDHAPAASPTAATTAPAAPAAPLPPPAAEQLVAVLRPLHRSPDGTYQLRIEMRPPELGRVDMRVEMKDGVLHASIHAERSETADLVRAALDDLRSRLDADGVRSGQLTVDAQGAGTSGRDQQAANPDRPAGRSTAITDPVAGGASPTTTTATSDSLLDVRI